LITDRLKRSVFIAGRVKSCQPFKKGLVVVEKDCRGLVVVGGEVTFGGEMTQTGFGGGGGGWHKWL